MTQAEELNLELELIFDNSPTFWHSRIGTDPEKRLDIPSGKWCIFMHFMRFRAFLFPACTNLQFSIFSPQLLGQPIEQPTTTNTSKHSPTDYNVRCGVIISSKRYACTHLWCMLDVPENSCVPLLTVTPPPIFYWRRRRKKSIGAPPPPPVKITRRAAAEILTSAQGSTLKYYQSQWDLWFTRPTVTSQFHSVNVLANLYCLVNRETCANDLPRVDAWL